MADHGSPLDPLVVDLPAGIAQQGVAIVARTDGAPMATLAVAVAAILARKFDDVGRQPFFIVMTPRHLALRRAVLPERPAGTALGYHQRMTHMLDAGAAARGAQ